MASRNPGRVPPRLRQNPGGPGPVADRAELGWDMRTAYAKRLDNLVDKMADAFKNTVASAQVLDKAGNARAEFQAQVETENLAGAAEALLALISELKTAVVVQDIAESDKEAKRTKQALHTDVKRAFDEVSTLREKVSSTLSALERHYYASAPHVRAHDAVREN